MNYSCLFVLASALLQIPAPQTSTESPNSPAAISAEHARHDAAVDAVRKAHPATAPKGKRCAKRLWLVPCPAPQIGGRG